MAELLDIKSMLFSELKESLVSRKMPSYRAKQVYAWITGGALSFSEMTNIPKTEKAILEKDYFISGLKIEKVLTNNLDGTKKYLFKLKDSEYIESVLMKYKYGCTACISTQVGCKMNCKFCATGMSGFVRDLTPGEMISQIQKINEENKIKVSRIVLMGMGEPLDNYLNVVKFLKIISSKYSLNIGRRNISLSTCGVVSKIYSLANENFGLTLFVSLHASNNKIRNKIMPINKKFSIEDLIKACRYYIAKTGRRISFEYVMIDGLNDTLECANELSHILKGMLCHVNLISLNKISKVQIYRPSSVSTIYKFKDILLNKGIKTTIRRSLGNNIDASCGQLRNKKIASV